MMTVNVRFMPAALAVAIISGCSMPVIDQVDKVNQSTPASASPTKLRVDSKTYGSPAHVETVGGKARRSNLVRVSSSPWLGGIQSVPRTEDRLPAVFNEKFALDFGKERVSLDVVAGRLTRLTNIPVRIRSDVFGAAPPTQVIEVATSEQVALPGAGPLPSTPLPGGSAAKKSGPASFTGSTSAITLDAVSMVWDGRLRDFLDHMTNALSLAWEYQDGTVVIMRMVTESYDMAAFPGKQSFSVSAGGSGGGEGGQDGITMTTQAATNVSVAGTMDVRESLIKAVREMVAETPGSSANFSDGTGRMVVVTSKETQAKIRDFLRKENKAMRRMVNVTFDLYSVRTKDSDEKGVDWSSVFTHLNRNYGVEFLSPATLASTAAGSLGVNVISGNRTTTTNALLTLLSQYGESTQHRPVSITTLNGHWDTKSRLSTAGYLKETTPGTAGVSGSAGAPGLKTDTVTTGDQFAVLPYVQNDNSVLLKYSISLSDLLGLFDVSTGSGETLQKVQTPQIDAINASSTIALAPHQTAVITGLSRTVAKREENRLSKDVPLIAGGSRTAGVQREHFVVLVRATPL